MVSEMLIVVEGVHDAAVVESLLKPHFEKISERSDVPEHWHRFFSTTPAGPHSKPSQLVPVFLKGKRGDKFIMIRLAGSHQRLATALAEDVRDLTPVVPSAIGILVDADAEDISDRVARIRTELQGQQPPLVFPAIPGEFGCDNGCKTGIFVVPDNSSPGTIEVLIKEAAQHLHPTLFRKAAEYVSGIDEGDVPARFRDDFNANGRAKAIVHSVGAVLKPGRPIQACITDCGWFDEHGLPRISRLRGFLFELIGI
jgi:hypothetical protein